MSQPQSHSMFRSAFLATISLLATDCVLHAQTVPAEVTPSGVLIRH